MPFYDGVALCLLTINKTKDRKREKKTTEKNCVFNVQLRDTPSYMCKFYCWLNSIQQTKEMTQESKKKREKKTCKIVENQKTASQPAPITKTQ